MVTWCSLSRFWRRDRFGCGWARSMVDEVSVESGVYPESRRSWGSSGGVCGSRRKGGELSVWVMARWGRQVLPSMGPMAMVQFFVRR